MKFMVSFIALYEHSVSIRQCSRTSCATEYHIILPPPKNENYTFVFIDIDIGSLFSYFSDK